MAKRRKKTSSRRRTWFFVGALLLTGATAGILGGLFFSHHAPETARGITETIEDAGGEWYSRLRGLLSDLLDRDGGHVPPPSSALGDGGGIQVFFVPNRIPDSPGVDEVLIELVRSARESVLCAFYDFELEHVADALIEQHEAGVRVAVVSDSDYDHQPGVNKCIRAGIPVVFDERSSLMHNKFCVVDGHYVWTGSTNITANCMYHNNNNVVLIESAQLAVNYTNEFNEMFLHQQFGAGSPRNTTHPTLTVLGIGLENYFAPEDGVESAIVARLADSRKHIVFMTFVFTSVPVAEAMADRLAAGAQVRGLIERRSAGSRYSRHEFLRERGAEVFIDANPRTMHHKVIIVDGRLVMTGSYNFSANAEKRNDENLIMIHDPRIATLFIEEFERIIP